MLLSTLEEFYQSGKGVEQSKELSLFVRHGPVKAFFFTNGKVVISGQRYVAVVSSHAQKQGWKRHYWKEANVH